MRPDRDAYIDLDCTRVCGSFVMKPPPNENEVDHCTDAHCSPPTCIDYGCNFHKLSPTDASVDWSGPYDVLSIMQYGAYSFARPPSYLPPMTPAKPGIPLRGGNGVVPTLLDLQRVCNLYYEDCRGICGDGILSPNNGGEECDDGNNVSGDGCEADCKVSPAVCGNGILEPGEACDDGNLVAGDGCDATCHVEFCGDGIVQPGIGEECDDGPAGSADCTPACKKACLQACDPDPRFNGCGLTASCIAVVGGTGAAGAGAHYCACAHGFRGAGVAPGDVSAQMRLPWVGQEGRVFVRPGVQCNVLCDQWTLGRDGCAEVEERAMCY